MVANLEIKIRSKCIRSSGSSQGLVNERGKDSGGEVGESPVVPPAGTAAHPWGDGKCHIAYPFPADRTGPRGALCPRPARGQLQSPSKPPCRRLCTPRSGSLELGLTLSEHKLLKGRGEERRGEDHTRGRNDHPPSLFKDMIEGERSRQYLGAREISSGSCSTSTLAPSVPTTPDQGLPSLCAVPAEARPQGLAGW